MKRWVGLILLCLLLSACAAQRARVRIGIQPFVGQAIVTHMLKRLLQDHTTLRPVIVACADTYDCLQALTQQRIDLVLDHDVSRQLANPATPPTISGLSAQLDLTWLASFRYDSGYALVMPTDRAVTLGISSIADLTTIKSGVRIAVPADYLRQARVGPYDLLRRYGLRLRDELQMISEPEKRLTALFAGKVDVSVIHRDSGLTRGVPITLLEDPLRFFPPAKAAIVVRSAFLQQHPALRNTFMPLQQHLSQEMVQQLSYNVQVEGWTPEIVADRFLRRAQLVSDRPTAVSRQPEILVAVDAHDRFGILAPLAVRAVREVFTGQPARLVPTHALVRDVIYGRAQLALLGAERFFQDGGTSRFGVREERIEAVGVVGKRYLHLVRRRNEALSTPALAGSLGLPPRSSGSAQVTVALLESLNAEPAAFGNIDELLDRVVAKQLDAALFFLTPGVNNIAKRLADDQLEVRSLPPISATLPPFVRPVRIPKATYADQTEPIDTVGIQVVIAGPAPQAGKTLRAGGPAGALPSQSLPVTVAQAQKLAGFFSPPEAPDPSLPSIWMRELQGAPYGGRSQAGRAILDTALSVFAALFLLWTGFLVLRRSP